MENILTLLVLIDWLANDVHYAVDTTKNFYARHLLADRVRDFGSAEDDIKEKYYLGFLNELPPGDDVIAGYAIKAKTELNGDVLERLCGVFSLLSDTVESVGKETLPRGVQNVLDDISSRSLTYHFLCSKEMMS